jgi:molybdopterin converting factor small subunit
MNKPSAVTVEFFGVPRKRAGRADLPVTAGTVREAAEAVAAVCPGLGCLVQDNGRLNPQYLFSVDGGPFVEDPDHPLRAGDRVLILSADGGG